MGRLVFERKNTHEEIINITASDWNTLASYVEKASAYCASSTITANSITRAAPGGLITAEIFNSLDGSIGKLNTSESVGTKTKDVDLIKDEDIKDFEVELGTKVFKCVKNFNDRTIYFYIFPIINRI